MDPGNFVIDPVGKFYGGRRTFLTDNATTATTTAPHNPLQPPPEFMTRRQMRNHVLVHKAGGGLEGLQKMDLFKEGEGVLEAKKEKARRQQREHAASLKLTKIHEIELFSSIDPRDWAVTLQAGCRMWVNKDSGEVSVICPFADEEAQGSDEDTLATGAAVYDSRELDDFFSLLDAGRR